jgi:hypothetical protein
MDQAFIFNGGTFFMSLFAGVLLAVGFQIVLTILSVATGISMVGNIEDRFSGIHSVRRKENKHSMLNMTNGVGMWMVLTSSVSLFCASLLAVKMSLIANNEINLTLALTIWAVFFIVTAYFEAKSVGYILGGLFSTVFGAMKSLTHLVQDTFGKSPVQKTAEEVRGELVKTLHDPHFRSNIQDYVRRFQPAPFDWHKARKELTKLLEDIEVKAKVSDGEGEVEKQTFIKLAHAHPHFNKEDIGKLEKIYDEVRSAIKPQESPSGLEADPIKEKIENYLKSTGVEALNPESLKEDLNKIVSDPKSTKTVVLNRIKQFDHPTIVSIVSKKGNISPQQADQVVQRVESALESIKEKVGGRIKGGDGHNLKDTIEEKMRNYFSSLQRPEFDYDQIKHDFENMLHDPAMSLEIIKNRVKTFNRDSLIALIESQPNISKEQAERIVSKIEEARENVIRKVEEVELTMKEKAREAKELALHEAEHVRQTVVVSAWWIFATAVVSAGASALGGMLAF